VEEGGEMVPWRRIGRRWVELFNASVTGEERKLQHPFQKGKEHARWLLVPMWRGELKMQWLNGGWHLN
jgi:hypothetical protein